MGTGERCEFCDRPKATLGTDVVCGVHAAHREYDDALKNREWPAKVDREWKRLTREQDNCRKFRVDWRARAIAAESALADRDQQLGALQSELASAKEEVARLKQDLKDARAVIEKLWSTTNA